MTIPFEEIKERLLADPKVKAEYDALAPEFEIAAEIIRARLRAGQPSGWTGVKIGGNGKAGPVTFQDVEEFREQGFEGFVTVSELQTSMCRDVPNLPGVYLVLRLDRSVPVFLDQSKGGHFKEKDPSVAIDLLERRWIGNTLLLNVGKAGGKGNATLKSRISQYMRFGQGIPVGHRGGRYIWQLHDARALTLCWKSTFNTSPRELEKELLRDFEAIYGRLPFANLRH